MNVVSQDAQRRDAIWEMVTQPAWPWLKKALAEHASKAANVLLAQSKAGTIEDVRFQAGKHEGLTDALRVLQEFEENAKNRPA